MPNPKSRPAGHPPAMARLPKTSRRRPRRCQRPRTISKRRQHPPRRNRRPRSRPTGRFWRSRPWKSRAAGYLSPGRRIPAVWCGPMPTRFCSDKPRLPRPGGSSSRPSAICRSGTTLSGSTRWRRMARKFSRASPCRSSARLVKILPPSRRRPPGRARCRNRTRRATPISRPLPLRPSRPPASNLAQAPHLPAKRKSRRRPQWKNQPKRERPASQMPNAAAQPRHSKPGVAGSRPGRKGRPGGRRRHRCRSAGDRCAETAERRQLRSSFAAATRCGEFRSRIRRGVRYSTSISANQDRSATRDLILPGQVFQGSGPYRAGRGGRYDPMGDQAVKPPVQQ